MVRLDSAQEERDLGVLVTAAAHEPAVCPGGQEGQWHPGLDQEWCGQQEQERHSSLYSALIQLVCNHIFAGNDLIRSNVSPVEATNHTMTRWLGDIHGGTCQSPALPALVRPPAPPLQPSLDIKPFLPFPLDTAAAVNLFPNFNALGLLKVENQTTKLIFLLELTYVLVVLLVCAWNCFHWAHAKFVKSKARSKFLHLGQSCSWYQYRLGAPRIESDPVEKNFGVLKHEKLIMTWQCVLAAQKDNCSWGYIKSNVAIRSKEVILLYSTLIQPQLVYSILF
ncbi:hypothetical protein DUI87_18382 [Hirundo rustica rustica]|uniref:Uncharacterized protein n=1 Tax=Hirundo rustica rustica TaxID=333673 RepID=A0A3M0JWR0_HIRRU|nr:hypothetical protein DUI87_18382 [Hirundo rustica rustica]